MSLDVTLYLDIDTGGKEKRMFELYDANITHNLNKMAIEAKIYGVVWRPDENGIETAGEIIKPLKKGIAAMKKNPDKFIKLNPSNGWGSYIDFIPWLEKYLTACIENPKAKILVSR